MGPGHPGTNISWALALVSTLSFIPPSEGDRSRMSRRDVFLSKESVLDMAPSSYDDQYRGCTEAMEAEIPKLFQYEYSLNKDFAEAWDSATFRWEERKGKMVVPPGFKDQYAIAIFSYTSNGPLHKIFNDAVRQAGQSRDYYLRSFNFKVLHYYLTRALQMLDAVESPTCHKVFRGIKGVRFKPEPRKPVRFGQFTSSSKDDQSALSFGEDTFFSIHTCYGVNIRNFSFFPSEEEVLIPPFEKFKVTDFSTMSRKNIITLQSVEKSSVYNCEFVKERRCKASWCPFNSASHPGTGILQIIPICWLMLLWGPQPWIPLF
ncbi:GPI-linked NAD(P)(+)--arginine ADP-ribosyltransferase 1 precursor [Xenopus tropicalis]|uniref:NAD(P)(+)--arginine ADP-ribosyltransferase n=2 Tax=Xenopus tropicalis TaxID=8364 RepID=Q08CZ9_XENTR|eukprot:NP_001072682.1 GPI-linked NAD(P)(+)--arginine ADP-ribosyltransferase 1 precursor [Xenopus tropicalis]